MQTQLRDRYLKDSRCRNGLYLVGWFTSPRWDEKDYREGKSCKMSIEDAQHLFQQQATDLSQNTCTIKSYVLNLSLSRRRGEKMPYIRRDKTNADPNARVVYADTETEKILTENGFVKATDAPYYNRGCDLPPYSAPS